MQTFGRLNEAGKIFSSHGIANDVTECYLARQAISRRLKALLAADAVLSERERRVLNRVVEGVPNKAIAKELSLTKRAIEQIRARLLVKFAAHSSAELVRKSTELMVLSDLISSRNSLVDDIDMRQSELKATAC